MPKYIALFSPTFFYIKTQGQGNPVVMTSEGQSNHQSIPVTAIAALKIFVATMRRVQTSNPSPFLPRSCLSVTPIGLQLQWWQIFSTWLGLSTGGEAVTSIYQHGREGYVSWGTIRHHWSCKPIGVTERQLRGKNGEGIDVWTRLMVACATKGRYAEDFIGLELLAQGGQGTSARLNDGFTSFYTLWVVSEVCCVCVCSLRSS